MGGLGRREREVLEPLGLAHRIVLGRELEERRRVREGFERVEGVLEEKSAELGRRGAVQRERKGGRRLDEAMEQLNTLHETVRKSWVGDEALKDAVVSGEKMSSGDRDILQSSESFLERASNARANGDSRAEKGILEDIEFKARSQNARMKRWQSMYDELQATRAKPAHVRSNTVANGTTGLRFDQHHDLNLDDLPPQSSNPPAFSPTKASYTNRYEAILTAMREDLRRAHNTRRSATAPVSQHPRKPSVTLDTIAGAYDRLPQHPRSPSAQRSPSQQTAPFRPGRMPSRSRSYQQPKVISQREPIPLKSELFSPLKSARHGDQSPASSRPSSLLVSPREEEDGTQAASMEDALSSRSSKRESQSSEMDGTTKIDSAVGLETASPMEMDQSSPLDFTTRQPSLPPPPPSPQPQTHQPRPSLAERTRISMAFTSAEDIRKPSSKPPAPTPDLDLASPPAPAQPTLVDRTRQSISHHQPLTHPNPKPNPRPSHTRTRSSITQHPINPFSTPPLAPGSRMPRRSSLSATAPLPPHRESEAERGQASPRRDITPREELFSASAEYDSVFKARPRVLVSPVGSPERDVGSSPLGR